MHRHPTARRGLAVCLSAAVAATIAPTCVAQGGIDLGKLMGGGGGVGSGNSCAFKCKHGAPPRPREGHKPTFNGCGVPGFKVDTKYGMTDCCNEHDICYHTCKLEKQQKKGQEICDAQFEECMQTRCAKLKGQDRQACDGEANMMSSGVRMFGCAAYQDSQAEACTCDLDYSDQAVQSLEEKERVAMLVAFYAKHDSSKTQGVFFCSGRSRLLQGSFAKLFTCRAPWAKCQTRICFLPSTN